MQTVYQIKSQAVTETPLLLFECVLPSGQVERWSTHRLTADGHTYAARVLSHNLLDFSCSAEDSIDAVSRITVTLANADSWFSQLHRTVGFRGARLTVRFIFADLAAGTPASSDVVVVFRGICDPPDEITEDSIRLSFASRLALHRILLPEVRIQRRCPWTFPGTPEQRAEAATNPQSPYYRCGYSPDVEQGRGSLNGSAPYAQCDYTRAACEARGMFDADDAGRETRRFGGIEFVPSTIQVKTFGEKGSHVSAANENESRYNDFVPVVYGTAWYRPPVVFARNDGNLTHCEVLLGMGEISQVIKVLANNVELPSGRNAPDATATGWYNVVSTGNRNGAFNLDFPGGDPYGSMAVLSVVTPNRLSDGSTLPRIEVLLDGQVLPVYSESGEAEGRSFTRNPAWILMDVLRRSGWRESELDLASFAKVASYCDEPVETQDLHGASRLIPRFQCNMVLRHRRSAADVVRGVRNTAGLYLTYGSDGLLQLKAESNIAIQQPEKPAHSNSLEPLNGGWPAYEFGDGSSPFSDILRRSGGEPAFRLFCRGAAESPNRFSVEFQDEFNEYQQDSLSLVDLDDAIACGQEVSGSLPALGLPNFSQASRVLRLALDRSIRGNLYVEFEAGLRFVGLKPGDLITITYAKEGLARQVFRVLRIRPRLNFRTAIITAQLHDDAWYAGTAGLTGGGRQPAIDTGVPRPLGGVALDAQGAPRFGVSEASVQRSDGAWDADLTVEFSTPERPSPDMRSMPLLDLGAAISTIGGSLEGGRSYYYAVSAVSTDGQESPLSFAVRAAVPPGTNTNAVTLRRLSFAAAAASFRVYRGLNPARLLRIADGLPVAAEFTDDGAPSTPAAPPDASYHHANFYWRMELLPDTPADIHGANSIGQSTLGLAPNEFRGKVVRISAGAGSGQERVIASHDASAITTATSWTTEPDPTSLFCIVESGWNFGAMAEHSPVTFSVPNRQSAVIHISGRAANVQDRECAYELSPLTRHVIGGAAEDFDVPDAPSFTLSSAGRGSIEISNVHFPTLQNTKTITAATLMLHCWDELEGTPDVALAEDIGADDDVLTLAAPAEGVEPGVLLQIGEEILIGWAIAQDGLTYQVDRGAYGTTPAPHTSDEPVYHVKRRITVLPFSKGLFASPAAAGYSQRIGMPNQRIVVAELQATNAKGNSMVTAQSFVGLPGRGLRTLSGGQLTIQVPGELAIQSDAAPALTIDESRPVRDVVAEVAHAPEGGDIRLRLRTSADTVWCELSIPAGANQSESLSGVDLAPLLAGSRLMLDVLSTGLASTGRAGSSLSVTIRL